MGVKLKVATVSKASCGTSYCGQITIGKGDPRPGGTPFASYFTMIKDVTVGPASTALGLLSRTDGSMGIY
jgi:hypothetical protein